MCDFGGITGESFSTPFNTIGVGDPVPASTNTIGSGDIFTTNSKKVSLKKGTLQDNFQYGQQLPYIVKNK